VANPIDTSTLVESIIYIKGFHSQTPLVFLTKKVVLAVCDTETVTSVSNGKPVYKIYQQGTPVTSLNLDTTFMELFQSLPVNSA